MCVVEVLAFKGLVALSQNHEVDMCNLPETRTKKSKLLDFLNKDGVQLKKPGFRLSHFTVLLIFLAFIGAIIASISMKSHWPIVAVAGAFGFRSVLAVLLKR